MRCIKHVKANDIYVNESEQEFYFYKYFNAKLRNFTTRRVYLWKVWSDVLLRIPITWDDIKAHHLEIKLYPGGRLAFIKV